MYHTKKMLIAVLLSFLMMGCTSNTTLLKNHENDYLSARSIPPLKIPPGLSSSTFQEHYPVSEKTYPVDAEKISIVPPEL
jgi:uncharacterized lipoprotein